MAYIWTLGAYRVKPGCADEFVRAWRELARHAVEEFGVAPPTILCDGEDASLYVTLGVWDSLDTLERFRSSPLVAERAPALDDLLDSAEARILEDVAHVPARGRADSRAGVEAVQAEEWDWSRTVVDHLDLHASDFAKSVRFYETILAPLAIPKLYEREDEASFTHVKRRRPNSSNEGVASLFLRALEGGGRCVPPSRCGSRLSLERGTGVPGLRSGLLRRVPARSRRE
jgi:quinol monooxygenase YgiN